jgi:hypothetical protein
MDQGQGAEEDLAARYLEFAEQFLALSDDDMDDEAAAAASILDLLGIAASIEEDDEMSKAEETPAWGGSRPGKAPNKNRDFMGAQKKLVEHYFSGEESLYNEIDFERRFRMPRSVFNRIHDALVEEREEPFIQKYCSVTKKPGISPLCRLVACLRKVCYGDADDREDEYLQLSETSMNESMKAFTRIVVEKFGDEYLNRCPSQAETKRALDMMAKRHFRGAFGAWDCKHFVWKNCPVYLQGQHKGHAEGGKKTLILEAVADCDGYIWYVFFGEPGSLNDLNVLDKSSIVSGILTGDFDVRVEPYTVNGTQRDWLYFLVDGIYLPWSIFVKPLQAPGDAKEETFNSAQEAARKCVERSFGQVVAQFEILKNPIRNWKMDDIQNLLYCCIILHNMVTAERRLEFVDGDVMPGEEMEQEEENGNGVSLFGYQEEPFDLAVTTLLGHRIAHLIGNVEDRDKHNKLMADLIAHVWTKTQSNTE